MLSDNLLSAWPASDGVAAAAMQVIPGTEMQEENRQLASRQHPTSPYAAYSHIKPIFVSRSAFLISRAAIDGYLEKSSSRYAF